MLQGISQVIYDIIGFDFISEWSEALISAPETGVIYALVFIAAAVLICLTVSFVFKFLLKLVDR